MSSYVILFCFFAASLVTDAVVLTKEADEIVVSADAKQQLMRSHNKGPDDDSDKKDKKESKTKVVIDLYYETRCPDCIDFINSTLRQFWNSGLTLKDDMVINMNPYGNSMSIPVKNVSDGYKFFHKNTTGEGWEYVHLSQHGAEEAFGNLVQGCAIKKVSYIKSQDLIQCMSSHPDWGIEKASYECMQFAKIDPEPIKACVESPEGNKIMAEFGKKTAAVKGRKGTPWVMVNGVNLVDASGLLKTACHSLSNAPTGCKPFWKKDGEKDDKDDKDEDAPPSGDGDFVVLPALKKKVQSDLVQVALNIPKDV